MNDTAAGAPSEESRPSQGAQELEFTWPDYIGWGAMINQARMEADWKGLWDYAIPHLHATKDAVASTEAQLGFRLPESYRNFLLASNGWPYFYLRPAGRRAARGRPDPAGAGGVCRGHGR